MPDWDAAATVTLTSLVERHTIIIEPGGGDDRRATGYFISCRVKMDRLSTAIVFQSNTMVMCQ